MHGFDISREHRPYKSQSQLITSKNNSSRRYANYSETDEDEEDEDEEMNEHGDEYDSDLADFIDDSMVDDLQREDLEETLRYYDKF
jgi:hypothetical protein